jgi:hypothetical protein
MTRQVPRFPRLILALCVAGALLGASTPGLADSSRQPAITAARAEGGVLHIFGINFGSARPKVTLGTLALSVVSVTASKVEAIVPATVAPGSYLLTVTASKGKHGSNDHDDDDDAKYDESWITIGGAGATGATGATGAAGAQGPQGPAGTAGLPGSQGPAGAAGPAGRDGAMGPAGPEGLQGIAGPVGPQGPAGPSGSSASLRTFVVNTTHNWTPGDPTFVNLVIECPAGSYATGGAADAFGFTIALSTPAGNGWNVLGQTPVAPIPINYVRASAICLRVS